MVTCLVNFTRPHTVTFNVNLSNFLYFTIPIKLSALVNRAKIRKDLMEFYIVSKLVGINGTVEDFEAFSLHYIILCSVLLNSYL